MKKLLVLVLFTFAGSVTAQTTDGTSGTAPKSLFAKNTWELGLTGSFSSVSFDDDDDTRTIVSMSISPSYYIIDGFFIEPEIAFLINSLFFDDDESGYQLLLNAGYTFKTSKSFAPYLKAGYGFGSMMTLQYAGTQGTPLGAIDEDESLSIVNAGVGVKWVVGGSAMIKTELNYRNQTMSHDENSNYDSSFRNIGLLLGLSIGL